MSNIDYSQYYVKFGSLGNKIRHERPAEPPKATRARRVRGKGVNSLFCVAVILCCFALTFLLAGVLNKDGIRALFNTEAEYFCYALVSPVAEGADTGLNELSKFVRAGGGGGNILQKDGKYYVVHSVYLNKKDAQTVQLRDKTSEIFGLQEKVFGTETEQLKSYVATYVGLKRNLVQQLYEATIENAKTEDNDKSIKQIIKMQQPFIDLKHKVLVDKNLNTNETLAFIVAMDTIIGRLEGLTVASATRISLVSDMRYQLFAIATTA